MRYLSLFSGVEAATVAWQPLGWECVAVAEIEPFPCAVLQHHYPNTPNLGDISKITKEQIMSLGHIDIVVGGFPCQDVSVAGLRKGLEDVEGNKTRSGLFFDAMRIVRWCREFNGTRFLLIENVPGLLSSKLGADFAAVLGEMVGSAIAPPKDKWKNAGVVIGPDGMCEWCILDAQYFGVPQRRRRVFALADFGNWADRPPILLEPESLCGNPPPSRETGKEVARSAGKSTARGSHWDGTGGHPSLNQCHNIGGVGMSNQEIFAQRGAYLVDAKNEAYCLQGNMIGRKEENGPQGDGVNKEISFTLNTLDRHGVARVHIPDCGGGSETLLCAGHRMLAFGEYAQDETASTIKQRDYKDATDLVTYAVRTANTGANGHGVAEEVTHTLDQANGQAVAACLRSGGDGGVPSSRGENLIVVHGTQDPCVSETTAFALGRNNGGENVVAFQQNTRDEVRLFGGDGKIVGALMAQAGMKQQNYVATLRRENVVAFQQNASGEVFSGEISGTVATNANASGRNCQMVLSIATKQYPQNITEDCAAPLCAEDYKEPQAVFQQNNKELAPTLAAAYADKRGLDNQHIDSGAGLFQMDSIGGSVRRLTPTECERLQGFPDDYTNIPWRGKATAPDGPRYKAMGNSMAVPVMRWIGERINFIDFLYGE